jgi:hypothetical protein
MSEGRRDEYDKLDEELRPYWESLVRAAHAKGLLCTGFLYGDPAEAFDYPYLVRFGNIETSSPMEAFNVHYHLAIMCAKLELSGQIERTVTSVDESAANPATEGQSALEIADKLALTLLVAPTETIPAEVSEILDQYLKTRRPPQIPEGGKV